MRVYVYANARTSRALAVLDCEDLSEREAKIPGHVKLASIQPGMVIRPAGDDGKPDMTKAHKVANVNQVQAGLSTIKFHSAGAPAVKEPPPAPAK